VQYANEGVISEGHGAWVRQGDSMLQFGHVPAARDAESQRNIVTPLLPVGAADCFVLKEGCCAIAQDASAMTPASSAHHLHHDFAL